MDQLKHYKFINSETGNVIYFLSIPENCLTPEKDLEETRIKIAQENGVYIGTIYYVLDEE